MTQRSLFLPFLLYLAILLIIPGVTFAEKKQPSTNTWILASEDYIDPVSFILADNIQADGHAYDDVFWATSGEASLDGQFDNDVWLVGAQVKLGGEFDDHVRVLGQTVRVDGTISNGLWAAGGAITATTNSALYGDQLLYGNNVTLLGHIEGSVLASARRITIGGTIVGDVKIKGDDIIVRPGTTIVGNFYYVTTNQTIVLDSNSNVSGVTKRIESKAASSLLSPEWNAMVELYLFGAALLVGIPFMLIFPRPMGHAVQMLRFNMFKCGMAGLLLMILVPLLIFLAAMSVLGIPLSLVLAAVLGLLLYMGKFVSALALGSILLGRRGQISASGALLALVAGLLLFYSMSLVPFVGSSLQTVAIAFGAGSLMLMIASGQGRVKRKAKAQQKIEFNSH